MKKFSLLLAVLLVTGTAYGQGTQINGTQIKDGTITDIKIAGNASIAYTKVNFTGAPATLLSAENPLTFNTPLVRTTNAISLSVVPVTLGGTGLTTVVAGRVPFGSSSSQMATSANFSFDIGTSKLSIAGLTVTGTTVSINGKAYVFPADYAVSTNYVLTDVAGNGTLSWQPKAVGVTLQTNDPPDTQDTGGINISGKGFFGNSVHMQANAIYFNTSPTDESDFIKWDNTLNRMRVFGWNGVDLGAQSLGAAAFSIINVSDGASQLIVAPSRFSTVTAGNVTAISLSTPGAPTVTPQGDTGAVTWTYKVVALLADGSFTAASATGTTGTGNATLTDSNFNTVSWSAVPGAYAYDVYRTVAGTTPSTVGKITVTPVTAVSFDDRAIAGDAGTAPVTNTTGIVSGASIALTAGPTWTTGSGSAGGSCVTGSLYTNTAGGAGSTLYVCESASWAAK